MKIISILSLFVGAQSFLLPRPLSLKHCIVSENQTTASKHTTTIAVSSNNAGIERREQLCQAGALGLAIISLGSLTPAALADSTGKYSTKQTAKVRYLPRVKRGVKAFQDLGKTLDQPATVQAFSKLVEDDLTSALLLYGSSTRIGELPDKKSRGLEKEVEDFVTHIKALAKGGDTKAAYGEAKEFLEAYLVGAKLEPLGSPDYK